MKIQNDSTKLKKNSHSSLNNKNHFVVHEERFNRSLLSLRNAGDIDDDVYRKIRSVRAQPPCLYGLPKIHKDRNDPFY